MHTTDCFEALDSYCVSLIHLKACRLIGNYGYTKSDKDDIEQELALHLRHSLPRYNPALGTLKTFVNCVLGNKIRSMIREHVTYLYDSRMNGPSLSDPVAQESGERLNRVDIIDSDDYLIRMGKISRRECELIELRIDVERVVSRLPANLQELCEQLGRQSIAEVSRDTGWSRGKIYDMKQVLLDAFIEGGLDEWV
ncbi:MAG: hypothetical protein ACYC1M_18875 [Armatimonadota bacterium]